MTSRCLIWLAALLSPIQALQGMHLFCSPCAGCADHKVAECHAEDSCCCEAKTVRDEKPAADVVGRLHLLTRCPCPPSCWCHWRAQPQLPSQQPVELACSVEMLGQAVDVTTLISTPQPLYALQSDVTPAITAQQLCASLCRFLT